jgi:threonine dehydratase
MVKLKDIHDAKARIGAAIRVSPAVQSHALSAIADSPVFLKLENLQRTGSFKERGALNKLASLSAEERRQDLVTASAGNHAQGVAYHAGRMGLKTKIWMPLTTPLAKVEATRSHGAEVILCGTNYDKAYDAAVEYAHETRCTFVHPFDDEQVIAGQGTIALELLEQVAQLEFVIVPVGGGGLISGIAVALKGMNPALRVIGVQSSAVPSMVSAVAGTHQAPSLDTLTIADGIAVRRVGSRTLPLVKQYVDDLVTVDEEEIANAVLFLLEREKTMAEGAGAVAVGAVLHQKVQTHGKVTAVVVSGGNIDVTLLARMIERGLVKDGRLVRLRIPLPDHPGALHQLTKVIAESRANIVETAYHRAFCGAAPGHTVIDMTMETRGLEHGEAMFTALANAGYHCQRIV